MDLTHFHDSSRKQAEIYFCIFRALNQHHCVNNVYGKIFLHSSPEGLTFSDIMSRCSKLFPVLCRSTQLKQSAGGLEDSFHLGTTASLFFVFSDGLLCHQHLTASRSKEYWRAPDGTNSNIYLVVCICLPLQKCKLSTFTQALELSLTCVCKNSHFCYIKLPQNYNLEANTVLSILLYMI